MLLGLRAIKSSKDEKNFLKVKEQKKLGSLLHLVAVLKINAFSWQTKISSSSTTLENRLILFGENGG